MWCAAMQQVSNEMIAISLHCILSVVEPLAPLRILYLYILYSHQKFAKDDISLYVH